MDGAGGLKAGRQDFLQPIMAGTLAAIVGYASTFTLVLAALTAAGASAQQAGSGLLSVCLALAVLNVVVAWRVKKPISFAWSTPGVAFILTVGEPVGGFPAVTGAFVVVAGAMFSAIGHRWWPRRAETNLVAPLKQPGE